LWWSTETFEFELVRSLVADFYHLTRPYEHLLGAKHTAMASPVTVLIPFDKVLLKMLDASVGKTLL
jgi:hypothetical protein